MKWSRWGRRSVATKKTLKTATPAVPHLKIPRPKDKVKIKTKSKGDDWYQAAFKRFSISQNRVDTRRDYLAALRPPIKPEL